jgi:hypothetical protein
MSTASIVDSGCQHNTMDVFSNLLKIKKHAEVRIIGLYFMQECLTVQGGHLSVPTQMLNKVPD